MNESVNWSHQSRVQISTRPAFDNLSTVAFIANIKTSPKTRDTDTRFQLTCIAQLKFVFPGREGPSRIWVRVYAVSNAFAPKFFSGEDCVYGFKVGDCLEGLLAPSFGDYKTAVSEAFDKVDNDYFDRLAGNDEKDLDPWGDLLFPLSSNFSNEEIPNFTITCRPWDAMP